MVFARLRGAVTQGEINRKTGKRDHAMIRRVAMKRRCREASAGSARAESCTRSASLCVAILEYLSVLTMLNAKAPRSLSVITGIFTGAT